MHVHSFSDGAFGGICNANTSSGCIDANAECRNAICQCVATFTDIDGMCKAGKLFHKS